MDDACTFILNGIIDHEADLDVQYEHEEGIKRFNVFLNDSDYPKVIGKNGLTIKAITDVLKLHEAKNDPSSKSKVFINTTSRDSAMGGGSRTTGTMEEVYDVANEQEASEQVAGDVDAEDAAPKKAAKAAPVEAPIADTSVSDEINLDFMNE